MLKVGSLVLLVEFLLIWIQEEWDKEGVTKREKHEKNLDWAD